jgi:hypothetical protein
MLLLGEGLHFGTSKSLSLENSSSIIELTFITTESFRETEKKKKWERRKFNFK